jgi:3-keto-5-aminohexanoate cleavage enzyme
VTGTIIEVALNGSVPKEVNPHVPRTPAEIASDALRCIAAGASVVHNHNDEAVVGGPAVHDWRPYADAWRAVLAGEPDAILYPTMGGWSPGSSIADRYRHVTRLAEEGLLGTPVIDLGGFNLGRSGPDGAPEPTDDMYLNTYRDMDYMFGQCGRIGLPVSMAVFEPGHLRAGLAYFRAGRVPEGSMLKFFFDSTPMGRPGRGLPPTPTALDVYLEMLDGFDLPWMAVVNGRPGLPESFMEEVLGRGGHLSVGIERVGAAGVVSNAEQVSQAARLCERFGRPPLSCAGTRAMLFAAAGDIPAPQA